jgi:hypothetical protein
MGMSKIASTSTTELQTEVEFNQGTKIISGTENTYIKIFSAILEVPAALIQVHFHLKIGFP